VEEEPAAPQGTKRSYEEMLETQAGMLARHRAWLRRRESQKQSWRPATRFRSRAKRLLRSIDNQLRVSTQCGGLGFFRPKDDDVEWSTARWRSWPWLGMASDLGSDNVAGYMALERSWNLNCDLFPDPSHGANRDTRPP